MSATSRIPTARDPGAGNWDFFHQRNPFVKSPQVVTRLGKLGGLRKAFRRPPAVGSVEKRVRIGGSGYIVLLAPGGGRLIVLPAPESAGLSGFLRLTRLRPRATCCSKAIEC
jgi:hypothetical protein